MSEHANVHAPPIKVLHTDLARYGSGQSAYVRVCPACKDGLLGVRRHPTTLLPSRVDVCSLCGQTVVYQDESIAGSSFHETLVELLKFVFEPAAPVPTPPTDADIAVHVLRLGTLDELPPNTTTPAEVLALFRGCTPKEAEQLLPELLLLRDLRFTGPEIAKRGGAFNWPTTIARLTGWDEQRARDALDAAEAAGLIAKTGVAVLVEGEIKTFDLGDMPEA